MLRGSRVGHPRVGPTGLEGREIPTLVLWGCGLCFLLCVSPVKSLGALWEGAEPPGLMPITGAGCGRAVFWGMEMH